MLSTACSGSAGGKTLDPRFIPGKFDITVINHGSPEAAGKEMSIHLNGEPPAGFKGNFTFPAHRENVLVHLDELVNEDGKRFNPTEPITALWIGGSGYQFTNYAE
jgi:hypothetical protein